MIRLAGQQPSVNCHVRETNLWCLHFNPQPPSPTNEIFTRRGALLVLRKFQLAGASSSVRLSEKAVVSAWCITDLYAWFFTDIFGNTCASCKTPVHRASGIVLRWHWHQASNAVPPTELGPKSKIRYILERSFGQGIRPGFSSSVSNDWWMSLSLVFLIICVQCVFNVWRTFSMYDLGRSSTWQRGRLQKVGMQSQPNRRNPSQNSRNSCNQLSYWQLAETSQSSADFLPPLTPFIYEPPVVAPIHILIPGWWLIYTIQKQIGRQIASFSSRIAGISETPLKRLRVK